MASTVEVQTRRDGNIGILSTEGYISGVEAEPIAEAAQLLVDDGVKYLVINLEKSKIANSLGISILIEVIEQMRELGGKVAFCCAVPILVKTFQIMGLLKVAELYDTEAESVEALKDLAS
jgi:anti-anti-sigma factor